RELNYSSDIDLIAVFDPDRFKTAARSQKDAAAKIIRDVVQLLEARTEHGYVFRTDLRLRPDPGSTQIAVSASAALDYYETIGQNWERMAYIKARVCAGDQDAGGKYLEALEPYVWRHHLDYWAIADIHAIKRQIHAQGRHAELDAKDFDVKLGRGGIREIEFFVQTQQLILGGRNSDLRSRETLSALRALEEIDAVDTDLAEDLDRAYAYLRAVEHRIQMVNDEQTHRLPDTPERRAQIARLCGVGPAIFEADLAKVRRRVHSAYSDLFAQEERLSGEGGNLVFTGVDDDPDTLATLAEMGFSSPETVTKAVRNWHRGGVAGTRSARGRQLLTVLTPRLLQMMADAGEPDAAFTRFGDFLSGVRGGVQALSLMLAEPALTADLIATMSFAPKLARDLASRPALLDAMLDARFQHPVQDDPAGEREAALRALAESCEYFEDVLNAARRFHREEAFRIGYQLLRGKAHAVEAGAAYADLADACIAVLADAAKAEIERRFGPWTAKWAVCGLGK
ncbi:MAG: glutamine-synthetase adenylyltransferase, partial [Pseudomonadota bacterium]